MDTSPSSSSTPSTEDRARLVEALRLLEQDPEAHPEAKRKFQGLLEQVEESNKEPHLTLEELQDYADHPDKQPLPEHLRRCRICMEVFQVLRLNRKTGKTASPGTNAAEDRTETRTRRLSKKGQKRLLISAAALVVVFFALRIAYQSPTLILESGRLQQESETVGSTTVPGRNELEALQETQLSLLDGSRITLAPGSTFRIGTRLNRERYFLLQSGQIRVGMAGSTSKLTLEGGPIQIAPGVATYTLEINEDEIQLEVLQGEVEAESPEGPFTLNAGERRSWAL